MCAGAHLPSSSGGVLSASEQEHKRVTTDPSNVLRQGCIFIEQ